MAIVDSEARMARWAWGFVALGVALRVARYALDFPLWWDESFVAVNFLRRGYLDLLRPLDYGQVCPTLFLWIELSAVRLLGFSGVVVAAFPVALRTSSVFLFRHLSRRCCGAGTGSLLAMAMFAVAFYPIRHSADVKPYASDLLAAMVLVALAVEWLRDRDRDRWLWVLAAVGPIAVALILSRDFVAAGIGLGLIILASRRGRIAPRLAIVAFGLATLAVFATLFLRDDPRPGGIEPGAAMRAEWSDSFPPISIVRIVPWLVAIHTGDLFSLPFGAFRPASTLGFGLALVAVVSMWRRGDRLTLAICLLPFAMGLMAAAVRAYPYGGSAHGGSSRFMQYLAPAIAILVGYGASIALARIPSPQRRARWLKLGFAGLILAGVGPIAIDAWHPYRAIQAHRSREFARFVSGRRWGGMPRSYASEKTSKSPPWESIHLNLPVALCNRAIYSPKPNVPHPELPRRFILSEVQDEERPALDRWLAAMQRSSRMFRSETIVVEMSEPSSPRRLEERYLIFEFSPIPRSLADR